MEKIILLVLPFFAASCGLVKQQASAPEPVNVMSFNIRYDNPEDSLDNWRYRKDRVANAIHFYDVDILGTQEVLHNQLEDLKLRLPEYGVVGVGREDGKEKGEYSALWYKKDRFNVLDSGYFWLSETPEGSRMDQRLLRCISGTDLPGGNLESGSSTAVRTKHRRRSTLS